MLGHYARRHSFRCGVDELKFGRSHGRQTCDTLDCVIARSVVTSELGGGQMIIDPFARNCEFAHPYTNDINPETRATSHLDAEEWLSGLYEQYYPGAFDGAILDPPFSNHQAARTYGTTNLYTMPGKIKRIEMLVGSLVRHGGKVVKFGYNSNFSHSAFECVGVQLVRYGGSMNDMIISVHERRIAEWF